MKIAGAIRVMIKEVGPVISPNRLSLKVLPVVFFGDR